ncbi:MAG: ATP-binding cassette domain-containing protein [Candidatus Ancaeobacter aquaticus]|nr:ATP-binding cassette domain-containing protein [Candidatus Ancaeobacter aquaticus]
MSGVVTIKNMSFTFDGKNILKDVNITIENDKLYCMIGPNGGGKTILCKLMAGIYEPTSGTVDVTIDGKQYPMCDAVSERRIAAGFVFETGGLISNISVRDNIALPKQYFKKYKKAETEIKIDEIIDYLGIRSLINYRPAQMSMSKRRIANIAMALANEPDIIIYDNPVLGLDIVSAKAIKSLIKLIKEKYNMVTVVATNDICFAKEIADSLIYVDQTVVMCDAPEVVLHSDNVLIKEYLAGESL